MIIIKSKFSQIFLIFSKVYAPHFVPCLWWRMLALHLKIVGVCPLVCGRCAVNIKLPPLKSQSRDRLCWQQRVGGHHQTPRTCPGQCSASGQLYPGLLCSSALMMEFEYEEYKKRLPFALEENKVPILLLSLGTVCWPVLLPILLLDKTTLPSPSPSCINL